MVQFEIQFKSIKIMIFKDFISKKKNERKKSFFAFFPLYSECKKENRCIADSNCVCNLTDSESI